MSLNGREETLKSRVWTLTKWIWWHALSHLGDLCRPLPEDLFCPSLLLSGVLDVCSYQISHPQISRDFSSKVRKRIKDTCRPVGSWGQLQSMWQSHLNSTAWSLFPCFLWVNAEESSTVKMLCQHEEKQQTAPKDATYWGQAGRAVFGRNRQNGEEPSAEGGCRLCDHDRG